MSVSVYQPTGLAQVALVGNANLDTTTTSAQTLVQLASPASTTSAPMSQSFCVTAIVVRNVSATALAATSTFSAGWNASAATASTGIFSASISTESLAAGAQIVLPVTSGALVGAPGQYLCANVGAAQAGSQCKVDVLGYFVQTA